MTKAEALKRIGQLHEEWALKHGDTAPATSGGDSAANADQNAPADVNDELMAEIKTILDQVDR